ncbi:fluoride efflux transporter CrcB [Nocardia sp. CA-129566]|uniref:fluoride efflux transporter CrcB n=1 Tax=Nocardia sp. CA-129566 TaxID=3239976 RepID=UPI003D97A148
MTWLLVIAGAAIGAPVRYLTDRLVQARHDTVFPWGTLTVNVVGSLTLGFLTGAATAAAVGPNLQLLIGTGFCGALTTYSTLSYETLRLTQTGARFHAIANLAATITAGIGAFYTGTALTQALWH